MFEEYIKQSEPDKKEKGLIWQTAIGLQQVDGLKPCSFCCIFVANPYFRRGKHTDNSGIFDKISPQTRF